MDEVVGQIAGCLVVVPLNPDKMHEATLFRRVVGNA